MLLLFAQIKEKEVNRDTYLHTFVNPKPQMTLQQL